MENQKNIVSKDNNIDRIIYQILNEAYHEFIQCYGQKHSEYIKERIESITDKVRKTPQYYSGAIASANYEMGVVYTKSDKLSAVLKHEMWHVYNNSATDMEKSLQHIPSRYLNHLEQIGYLRQIYETTMAEYKEKWKDEPERLQHLLVDYEEFKNKRFDFGDSQVEMWAEWFNSQTHLKDMQDNFWDWGNGYFTKTHSSDSFYDSYLNIASILSCIVPKEKLLEMYLQTGEYRTDYSYPEMLEDFDQTYGNVLNEEERKTYQYPYLKIIMDVRTIDENARKNPDIALNTLQDCMKTCFKAYLIKLDNIKEFNIDDVKQIYDEIKFMQEHMLWNIDISKMQGLEYANLMEEIQNKFKTIVHNLGVDTPELKTMAETIDYTTNNSYKTIENGNEISARIIESQNEDITDFTNIDSYILNIGQSGVKGNLYRTLFTILGDEKFKFLFENFQNRNEENPLARFYNKIENITNECDIIGIYNEMYALYEQRLCDTLKTDENISALFDQYSKEIVELQKNGLFEYKEKKYLPSLESIIALYNQRVKDYVQEIDIIAEEDKERNLQEGRTVEEATRFSRRIPDWYIGQLKEQQSRIDIQRDTQAEKFLKNETISISDLKKDLHKGKINTTEVEQAYARLANAKTIEDIQLKKQTGQQLTVKFDVENEFKSSLKPKNPIYTQAPKTLVLTQEQKAKRRAFVDELIANYDAMEHDEWYEQRRQSETSNMQRVANIVNNHEVMIPVKNGPNLLYLLKAARNLSIDGEKDFLEEIISQPEVNKTLLEIRKSGLADKIKTKAEENRAQKKVNAYGLVDGHFPSQGEKELHSANICVRNDPNAVAKAKKEITSLTSMTFGTTSDDVRLSNLYSLVARTQGKNPVKQRKGDKIELDVNDSRGK